MATTYYVDPAVGDNGNLGTSEGVGNAWQTIQYAADHATTAGDIVYVKASATITLAAIIDFDTYGGSAAAAISFVGYTSVITDNGRVVIDGNSAVVNCFKKAGKDYLIFKNFELKNATGNGFYEFSNYYSTLVNIVSHNNGGIGIYLNQNDCLSMCSAYSNSGKGFSVGAQTFASCLSAYDNGGNGIEFRAYNNSGSFLLAHHNTGVGVYIGNVCGYYSNLTSDGNTSYGIKIDNSSGVMVQNSLITNNGATGLYFNSGSSNGIFDYNAFYNNTTADTNGVKGGHEVTLTADPYTNIGSDDFTLNSTAGGGAACKAAGFPLNIGLSATKTSYIDIGACQAVDSGTASVFPAETDVKTTVSYGPTGVEYTGNVTLPAESNVKQTIQYGANGTEFTGSYAAAVPTFAGVTQIERIGGGAIKVYWSAGTGTISGYRIYVRPGSSTNLFTSTYLAKEVPSTVTSTVVKVGADNTTFFDGTQAVYIGVRAFNEDGFGVEDTNTVSYYVTPDGTGSTYIKIPQELWSL